MIDTTIKRIAFVVLAIAFTLNGCNLINPEESAPSYIEIPGFQFNPTPTSVEMGSSSSTKIKDVWVYVDNQFQGVYELPARFPVLKTGINRILLTPGIYQNGIAATRSPYPFYKGYYGDFNLPANGTLTINPTTSYFDSVQCAYCESFDGSGFSLSPTSNSDTIMYQLATGDTNIFEGASSGIITLDTARTQFELTSNTYYDLPGSGAAVYLEMDYKCSQQMEVGLFVDVTGTGQVQVPVYTVNATSKWNKVYVQLGYAASAYSYSNKFKVYFKGVKDSGTQKATFYLDNIKVAHF